MRSFFRMLLHCQATLSLHYARFLLDARSPAGDTVIRKFESQRQDEFERYECEKRLYMAVLTRYPNWFEGHQRLARLALLSKAPQLAYGSSLALKQLAQSKSEQLVAKKMLGEVQLLRGDLEQARQAFEECMASEPTLELKELYLTCLIQAGELLKAQTILESIGTAERSAEVQVLSDYVRMNLET